MGRGDGVLCAGHAGVMVIDQPSCQPETPDTGLGYPFGVRIHTRDIIPFSSHADIRGITTTAREPTN